MLDEGRSGSWPVASRARLQILLSALGHAIGVVGIVIDFRPRTKPNGQASFKD